MSVEERAPVGGRWRLSAALALSGAAALVDEVVWVRLLGHLFGHTVYAVHVVLAVFFAGLGAGSALSDRLRLRPARALALFAACEVAVGLAGIAFPTLVGWATPFHDRWAPATLETGGALLFRLGLAGAILAVPTVLMGASFPLVVRWLAAHPAAGSTTAAAYAANTLGGAAGAWACAFLLVPRLGVQGTLMLAAGGNVLAAGLALWLRGNGATGTSARLAAASGTPFGTSIPGGPPGRIVTLGALAVLLFATGTAALALEVLWARALDQVLSGTVYSFATVLAVFLLGIGLGGLLCRGLRLRFAPLPLLAAVELILAHEVIASLFLIRSVPSLAAALQAALGPGFVARGIALESVLCGLVLLPPTLCMGVLFPLLLDLAVTLRRDGRVGTLVAANTVGSVAGPLLAGFVLLPRFGIRNSLLLVAWMTACVAVAVIIAARLRIRLRVALPVLSASAALLAFAPGDVRFWGQPVEQLVDYREDPAATLAVVKDGSRPEGRRLKVNNTYSLGGGAGLAIERRQGHLAMLMHPAAGRVLVLGVGTGHTLGAISRHRPPKLRAVELVPGVLAMARDHFGATNERVLEDPGVDVLCMDALRAARLARNQDLVVGDLFHPWQAGVGSLYSREHFLAVRRSLAEGGVFCQWLPVFQLSAPGLRTIVRTFLSAFPVTEAWLGGTGTEMPTLALLGSERSVRLHWRRWEERLADPAVGPRLVEVGLDEWPELVGGYLGGRTALGRWAGEGPLNTVDRPVLEFEAPRLLFSDAFEDSIQVTLRELVALRAEGGVPVAWEGARRIPEASQVRAAAAAVRAVVEARLLERAGDAPAALRAARRAARSAPGYEEPVTLLVDLARRWQPAFPVLAEEALAEAARARPRDPEILLWLGSAQLEMGRSDAAAEAFRGALALRPGWLPALLGLRQTQQVRSE